MNYQQRHNYMNPIEIVSLLIHCYFVEQHLFFGIAKQYTIKPIINN